MNIPSTSAENSSAANAQLSRFVRKVSLALYILQPVVNIVSLHQLPYNEVTQHLDTFMSSYIHHNAYYGVPCILIFWFKRPGKKLFVFHIFSPGTTKGTESETKKVRFTGKKRRLSAADSLKRL